MSLDEAHRRVQEVTDSGETVLDLSDLDLTELPPQIAELTPLTGLLLDDNHLTALPDWLPELSHLTQLITNQWSI